MDSRRPGSEPRANAADHPRAGLAPLLRLRAAAFGYGERTVVSAVDLEIAPGSFLGIVGANGSGKTTFFRGLLGLIPPRSGTVERLTKAIGYVPQRETLDPLFPLRVDEVVHMGAYARLKGLRRLPPEERELARRCLERVGLLDRQRESFAALSGGQRQRVLIARALMPHPQILLLDEPTSGVDSEARLRIVQLLAKLHGEGLSVLLVSHQLALLRSVVQGLLWVANGRVLRRAKEELSAQAAQVGVEPE